LDGTIEVYFSVPADERYEFIALTVRRVGYGRLKRDDKAALLRFLERTSGNSRQQISSLSSEMIRFVHASARPYQCCKSTDLSI